MGCKQCIIQENEINKEETNFNENEPNKNKLKEKFFNDLKEKNGEKKTEVEFYDVIGEENKKKHEMNPFKHDKKKDVLSGLPIFEPGPVKLCDGTYYYGSWNTNGLMDGYGQFYADKDGTTMYIDGFWNDGNIQRGKVISNDCTYEGNISEGLFEGEGKMEDKDGIFEGYFEKGYKRNGKMVFNDGTVYEGDYENGEIGGKGTFTWKKEQATIIYDGELLNGIFNGKGTLTYTKGSDKSVYEGYFKNGIYHGRGKFTWPDKECYDGQYYDGKRQGKGKYKFSDDTHIEGNFESGELQGKCNYYQDGYLYSTEYMCGTAPNSFEVKDVDPHRNGQLSELPKFVLKNEDIEFLDLPHLNVDVIHCLYMKTERDDDKQKLENLKFSVQE